MFPNAYEASIAEVIQSAFVLCTMLDEAINIGPQGSIHACRGNLVTE